MKLGMGLIVAPLLDALMPKAILEIGAEAGAVTQELVGFGLRTGAVIDVIEPAPLFDVDELKLRAKGLLHVHRALSLDVLPELPRSPDLVLIDGDHNYHTVFNELHLLERRANDTEKTPPVVVLHDVGWPYARRDLYYDPDTIPADARQSYARTGLRFGSPDLVPDGFNNHLQHARAEGTPRNGVLTAVEAAVKASPRRWHLRTLPGLHGFGVLSLPEHARHNPAFAAWLRQISGGHWTRRWTEEVRGAPSARVGGVGSPEGRARDAARFSGQGRCRSRAGTVRRQARAATRRRDAAGG